MKKILALAAAFAMLAAVSAVPARANPVLVTVPAWVIVAGTATLVVGMVAMAAVAKQKGCHWASVTDVSGRAQSVYICSQ